MNNVAHHKPDFVNTVASHCLESSCWLKKEINSLRNLLFTAEPGSCVWVVSSRLPHPLGSPAVKRYPSIDFTDEKATFPPC